MDSFIRRVSAMFMSFFSFSTENVKSHGEENSGGESKPVDKDADNVDKKDGKPASDCSSGCGCCDL